MTTHDTLDASFTALSDLVDGNEALGLNDLRELASKVSVAQVRPGGHNLTVLYPGSAAAAGIAAQDLAHVDPRIAILDNTVLATFLNSQAFIDSIADVRSRLIAEGHSSASADQIVRAFFTG